MAAERGKSKGGSQTVLECPKDRLFSDKLEFSCLLKILQLYNKSSELQKSGLEEAVSVAERLQNNRKVLAPEGCSMLPSLPVHLLTGAERGDATPL